MQEARKILAIIIQCRSLNNHNLIFNQLNQNFKNIPKSLWTMKNSTKFAQPILIQVFINLFQIDLHLNGVVLFKWLHWKQFLSKLQDLHQPIEIAPIQMILSHALKAAKKSQDIWIFSDFYKNSKTLYRR